MNTTAEVTPDASEGEVIDLGAAFAVPIRTKLVRVGGSIGIYIKAAIVEHYRLKEGDPVRVYILPDKDEGGEK